MPFNLSHQHTAYSKVAMLALFTIFILGLVLRLQAVTLTEVDTPVRADALKYVLYAYNMSNFGIYTDSEAGIQGHPEHLKPNALVTPGYPVFLSLFIGDSFSDNQLYKVLLTQAILSALVIVFAYILFAELGWMWALFAALCVAFSPHLVSASTYLLTETLFCFFLIAFLAASSRLKITTNQWLFFAAGLLLGLATLTRPWTQLFIILLLVMLITSLDQKRISRSVWAFLGFVCVMIPWFVRNYLVLGMATDPSLSVYSIQHGMYPDMMYNFMPESLGFPYRYDPWVQDAVISSQTVLDELYRRIQANPWIYLEWYSIGKLQTVFSWSILAGMGDVFIYPIVKTPYATSSFFQLTHMFIYTLHNSFVMLSLIATVFAWLPLAKRVIPTAFLFTFRLLSLLMIYFMILHMIGAPFPRYSIPMRPVIYGLAIVMLAACWNYLKILYQQRKANL
ncbi:glycosyltransferase family 39 protein [Candidatus Albibeggiatoa sp. nov. NOAA]|uniref:glycosyltransferase family 39 protein n=1 Tax=Candidatus Albibeggiatoa sp. nov. NOAA TaxID=3162724 RepID=UPI0032F66C23|nr:glycosyltransferase family 39 protein [Thiotrichaceae bacterium]